MKKIKGNILLFILASLCIIAAVSMVAVKKKITVWNLSSLNSIGDSVEVWGNPTTYIVPHGISAMMFNGKTDGLLVNKNPIDGAESFTIEVVFNPSGTFPENFEQRFLHIQDPKNSKRRILMELRLNKNNQWYPDLYMKADDKSLTLIDSTKTHPINEWATIKLVYKNKKMTGFVNGVQELSGDIEYLPIASSAKVSLGTRMDKRSWFNGMIKTVTFTKEFSSKK